MIQKLRYRNYISILKKQIKKVHQKISTGAVFSLFIKYFNNKNQSAYSIAIIIILLDIVVL